MSLPSLRRRLILTLSGAGLLLLVFTSAITFTVARLLSRRWRQRRRERAAERQETAAGQRDHGSSVGAAACRQ